MLREWLYRYDWVRDLKERVRPYVTRPHEIYEVIREIGDARMIYDVGAAVGDKTITFLRAFSQATVVAFEPHPQSFETLRKRTRKYKNRIRVLHAAVSDANGVMTLRLLSYADASSVYPISSFLMEQGKREEGTATVSRVMLDSLLPIDQIDLLKIDVEGHELEVLNGAKKSLQRTKHVFVEILDPPRGPDNRKSVPDLLIRSGFRLRKRYGQDYWFAR